MSRLRFLRGARWALILSIPFGLMLLVAVNAIGLFACRHQWVRARFDDGEYGYRCSQCGKRYAMTWDRLLQGGGMEGGEGR